MPKSKSPYFYFMLHFQKQEARRGRHYPGGLREIQSAASESWNKMNALQRSPFVKRAKTDKLDPRKEVEKYTSQGTSISVIEKEEERLKLAKKKMEADILEIVRHSYTNNTMGSHEYFFVSGNYFIKTDDICLPAELAIIKFTFDYGIVNKFHIYINPGKIPMGFQSFAKDWSEEYHRLPYPPNAKGEKNFTSVLQQIKNFIGNESSLPPLFTVKEDIPIIESFIRQFCAPGDEDPSRYRVYPLHQLFFDIKGEAVRNSINGVPCPTIHVAEAQLKSEQFNFLRDTACNYHEEIDCTQNCSLSIVQRWAYTFAAHICGDLNITLIPGQHYPLEGKESYATTSGEFSKTT